MRLRISIPRAPLDALRKFVNPSHGGPFVLALICLAWLYVWGRDLPAGFYRLLQATLLIASLLFAGMGIGRKMPRAGIPYVLGGTLIAAILQLWWRISEPVALLFFVMIAVVSAILYGSRDTLILIGMIGVLELAGHGSSPDSGASSLRHVAARTGILAGMAILVGYLTRRQRSRIMNLKEELTLLRSSSYAFGRNPATANDLDAGLEGAGTATDLDTLEESIGGTLKRIKDYFRAHTVALFQPYGEKSYILRHSVSDCCSLQKGIILDASGPLFGTLFTRRVSCNWSLEAPGSRVSSREIPYYGQWQPVRHLAACPLGACEPPAGMLVVDRILPCAFTDSDIRNLELFALQLMEMIQMGRRYLDQVDRNMEYRLFYRAMSELGGSLATQEVLEALALACRNIIESSHIVVALVDETGLSYEIAYCEGVEGLKGTRVGEQGKTWIAWMLNSGQEPLLLRDIRSHATHMPIASPGEPTLPVRSMLLLPLVSKDRNLGVMFLGSGKVDYYRNWQMKLLMAICRHAASDIENSLLHRRVENEALTDGLTRLENHRYFQERLKRECSRARRTGAPISLIMMDIDHFKQVNDNYGHRVGDMILMQMAEILKGAVRSEDSIARYGGEEFVVILTDSDRKGALKMGERLRKAVERTAFLADDHSIRLSITAGTATFPADGAETWSLIEHADQALYSGKAGGRNRVVQYHSLQQLHSPS